MRVKVSNYISQWLVDAGICQAFMVTGGGAMHLDDALGHQPGLACIYNHHEQACAIAAESYARIHNRIAALCVTTGPGGTNAITGVLGGWLDSIPMLILSGQVRYDTTARWSGVGIRAMGDQEFDICQAISCMTKYSEMVIDPLRIRYCLEKALYLAKSGRPGPCWLDIPLDVREPLWRRTSWLALIRRIMSREATAGGSALRRRMRTARAGMTKPGWPRLIRFLRMRREKGRSGRSFREE